MQQLGDGGRGAGGRQALRRRGAGPTPRTTAPAPRAATVSRPAVASSSANTRSTSAAHPPAGPGERLLHGRRLGRRAEGGPADRRDRLVEAAVDGDDLVDPRRRGVPSAGTSTKRCRTRRHLARARGRVERLDVVEDAEDRPQRHARSARRPAGRWAGRTPSLSRSSRASTARSRLRWRRARRPSTVVSVHRPPRLDHSGRTVRFRARVDPAPPKVRRSRTEGDDDGRTHRGCELRDGAVHGHASATGSRSSGASRMRPPSGSPRRCPPRRGPATSTPPPSVRSRRRRPAPSSSAPTSSRTSSACRSTCGHPPPTARRAR